MKIIDEMFDHAEADPQNEVCGLVVVRGDEQRVIRARNLAEDTRAHFDLDPEAWLEVGDDEDVVAVYHSHPHSPCTPSMADLRSCEITQMPWYIVQPFTRRHHYFEPSGYEAPYEGRPYVWGVTDCYTLVQDFYEREFKVVLPAIERPSWEFGRDNDLFTDNFARLGFVSVAGQEPKRGDCFLAQFLCDVPNHVLIYMGEGKVLHHVYRRLSKIEPWVGVWPSCTVQHLRHQDLVNA